MIVSALTTETRPSPGEAGAAVRCTEPWNQVSFGAACRVSVTVSPIVSVAEVAATVSVGPTTLVSLTVIVALPVQL